MITVFTPAYNRAKELVRLYDSLLTQDYADFEWLIVDDGSADNTKEVVDSMILEGKINIRYIFQENRGKSMAVNHGIDEAAGDVFFCIDSDDYFLPNVLGRVAQEWETIKDDPEIAGLGFLHYHVGTTDVVGTAFPTDGMTDTYYGIYNIHKVTGDKQLIFKTDVMRANKFPEYPGEKFVPEALVYNRISGKLKMKFFNTAIVYKEYLASGYTAGYFRLCKRNPKAQCLFYKELYALQPSLYNAAAYDMYCMYAGKKMTEAVKEHPAPLAALMMYLPAYVKRLLKERE